MKNACEGVMYPKDAAAIAKAALATNAPENATASNNAQNDSFIKVPHKAWSLCKKELDAVFSQLASSAKNKERPKRIFVLAPLHKGPIIGERFAAYTPCNGVLKGSDWEIPLETSCEITSLDCVGQNDDVCTEEHSLEIIAPYLAVLYPRVPVAYLLAPENNAKLDEIKRIIGRMACDSIIIISDNEETHCASMWY